MVINKGHRREVPEWSTTNNKEEKQVCRNEKGWNKVGEKSLSDTKRGTRRWNIYIYIGRRDKGQDETSYAIIIEKERKLYGKQTGDYILRYNH